ncbi:phosphoenolpyruvate--protein phosphotransferase, partial [Candidatus Poribacteria bacterium]|nr:phosphoenolpyruvate--protein phosphotransferase [Candidatus Poribacteria bacterium]
MTQGIAASPGVVIGKAFLFRPEDPNVPKYVLDDANIEKEIARFHSALDITRHQLEDIKRKSEKEMPGGYSRIFKAYIMILEDPMFVDEVHNEIRNFKSNAEYAVMKISNELIELISKIENEYVSERAVDIRDVVKRIISNLLGKERTDLSSLSSEVIVIAHDLSPSDTALMNKNYVLGFATDVGSRTSHTSI